MRPLVAIALVAGLANTAFAQPPRQSAAPTPADALKAIAADLKEARGLLRGVADRPTRDRLELLLTRSELAAAELAKAAAEAPRPGAMPAADFAKVLAGLKGNAFDDGKLAFVRGLGKTARFTSAQAKDLLAAFSFDQDRVTAAVALHPLVTDPELFFQALDAFKFESSKKQVREKLGFK